MTRRLFTYHLPRQILKALFGPMLRDRDPEPRRESRGVGPLDPGPRKPPPRPTPPAGAKLDDGSIYVPALHLGAHVRSRRVPTATGTVATVDRRLTVEGWVNFYEVAWDDFAPTWETIDALAVKAPAEIFHAGH